MRNRLLQELATAGPSQRAGLRQGLRAALTEGGGPLQQDLGTGRVVVTFVVTDVEERPVVRCQLFPGVDGVCPMEQVPGERTIWWAEAEAQDDLVTVYQFQRSATPMPGEGDPPLHDPEVMARLLADMADASFADPYNPHTVAPDEGGASVPVDKRESVLRLSGAPDYHWHDRVARRGRVETHEITSARMGNTRDVHVWTPPDLPGSLGRRQDSSRDRGPRMDEPGHEGLPLVILLDGQMLRTPTFDADRILDRLVGGGHTSPFLVAYVDNPTPTSRMIEFPCNEVFAGFLADELVPWLRARYPVSADPSDIALGGLSYGGLASVHAAFVRPDTFGAVLSMSSSLWWGKLPPGDHADEPHLGRDDAPEWLTRRIAVEPRVPVRFWIDIGVLEDASLPFAEGRDMIEITRRFRDTLAERGYDVVGFREQSGGHDVLNWRSTLPLGLMALFPAEGRTHSGATAEGG